MKGKISPSIIFTIVGIAITFIGTGLFYNWYVRPRVTVEIKEFELPKAYTEIIKEEASKLPKISIIELINEGKSTGNNLTVDFKTNNNTIIQEVNVEARSNVLKYITEELKDGSSILRVDLGYIRPRERVVFKVLTKDRANFFIAEKLMMNGEVGEKQNSENIFFIIGVIIGAFVVLVLYTLGMRSILRSTIKKINPEILKKSTFLQVLLTILNDDRD